MAVQKLRSQTASKKERKTTEIWRISSINIMIIKCDLLPFVYFEKIFRNRLNITPWNSGNFHQNAQNAHLNVFKLTSLQQAANQATTSQQEHLKQMISDLRFGLFFWWPGWVASKVVGFLLLEKKKQSFHTQEMAGPDPPAAIPRKRDLASRHVADVESGRSFLAQNVEVDPNQPWVVEEGHAQVHLPDRNQDTTIRIL